MMNSTKEENPKDIINQTGTQSALMKPNIPIREEIMPVIMLNKFSTFVISGICTNATSANIMTTLADKDFYITSITLSFVKDITATTTYINVATTINSLVCILLQHNTTTLTIERDTATISYAYPVKVDRNRGILIQSATNVANFTARTTITGFYL